jgi:dTDP-4-dehydrorhamnose 3,5-epimerase-like enzyme
MYNDPELKIKWVLPVTDISARDMTHPSIDKSFQGIKI